MTWLLCYGLVVLVFSVWVGVLQHAIIAKEDRANVFLLLVIGLVWPVSVAIITKHFVASFKESNRS